MSEVPGLDVIYNQIEADPPRDFHNLLRRISIDIFALRASAKADDNSPVSIPSVVVSGVTHETYNVTSDCAEVASVSYKAHDDPTMVEQLTYVNGVLWHTNADVSEQVLPTLEGVRQAVTISLALNAARGPAESAF